LTHSGLRAAHGPQARQYLKALGSVADKSDSIIPLNILPPSNSNHSNNNINTLSMQEMIFSQLPPDVPVDLDIMKWINGEIGFKNHFISNHNNNDNIKSFSSGSSLYGKLGSYGTPFVLCALQHPWTKFCWKSGLFCWTTEFQQALKSNNFFSLFFFFPLVLHQLISFLRFFTFIKSLLFLMNFSFSVRSIKYCK